MVHSLWKVMGQLGAPALIYILSVPADVLAIPIELSFTGNVFNFPTHTVAYVPSTLSGRFIYEAAAVTSPIESLISVDFTIAGHSFSLAELGFANSGPSSNIGALINGEGVSGGTIDFVLSFIRTTPASVPSLLFADGAIGSFQAIAQGDFTAYSLLPVASNVPESASSIMLLVLGLSALVFLQSCQRWQGSETAHGS